MAEMTHAEVAEELSAYLDGELEPDRAASVDAHLTSCEECSALLEELRATHDALASLGGLSAPDDFVASVQRTIEARSRGRFFRPPSGLDRLPYEAVAVTMVVMLAAFLVMALGQPTLRFSTPSVVGAGADGGVEGSWGDPRGASYRLRFAPTVDAGNALKVIAQVALAAELRPPAREEGLLIYRVPPPQLRPFLEQLSSRVALQRVERIELPAGTPTPGGVPVELVLPR